MDFVNQSETYLAVMIASLEKKSDLLEQLFELSKQQEQLIKSDKFDDEQFNRIIEEKGVGIAKIQELDQGFDKLYQSLKEELTANPGSYKKELQKLKDLISTVTDRGVQLQALEMQNKTRMEAYFRSKRKEIKDFNLSSQTATSYYKNMTDQYQQQSYFFDKKK